MDAVNEASKVFRTHFYELSLAIGPSIFRVTTALYSNELLSMETKDKVTTTPALSEYEKAMIVVSALDKQLCAAAGPDEAKDNLVKICSVLRVQHDPVLREKCDLILGQLGVDVSTLPTYVKCTVENVHEHVTDVSTEMNESIKSTLDLLGDIMRHIELIKEAKFLGEAKSFYKMFIDFNKSVIVLFEKVQYLLHCCSAGDDADKLKKVLSECAELFEKCLKAHDDVYKGAKHVSHQCEAQAIEIEKKLGTIGHEGIVSFIGRLTSLMDSDTSNEEKFKETIYNVQDVSGRATTLKEDKERYRRFYENFEKIVHILRNLLVPVKCLAEKVQVLETIVTISPGKVLVPSIKEFEEKLNKANSILSDYTSLDLD